jgi:hypothetical protein
MELSHFNRDEAAAKVGHPFKQGEWAQRLRSIELEQPIEVGPYA